MLGALIACSTSSRLVVRGHCSAHTGRKTKIVMSCKYDESIRLKSIHLPIFENVQQQNYLDYFQHNIIYLRQAESLLLQTTKAEERDPFL